MSIKSQKKPAASGKDGDGGAEKPLRVHKYRAVHPLRLSGGVEVEMSERLAAKRGARVERVKELKSDQKPDPEGRDWFVTTQSIDVKRGEVFALRGELEKGQRDRAEEVK